MSPLHFRLPFKARFKLGVSSAVSRYGASTIGHPMALETGTYISDLVTSNPAGTDTLDKADDHLRLIKTTLKNTFPNASGAIGFSSAASSGATILSVTDNTNAALRITQLGTGPALRVEDSANPDTTPFIVTATGNVGIGDASPGNKLTVYDAATAYAEVAGDAATGILSTRASTDASSGFFSGYKSRGTTASRTIVANGDSVAQFAGYGYDGSAFRTAGYINIAVDGTPGLNDMPGRIQLFTTPDGSATAAERMRITQAGRVGIGETAPSYRLDVVEASVANVARIRNGSSGGTPSTTHGELIVESADATLGVQLLGTNTSNQRILFGDVGSNSAGQVVYDHTTDSMRLHTSGSERLRILSDGKVGIGTTNPAVTLEIADPANSPSIYFSGAGGVSTYGYIMSSSGAFTIGASGAQPIVFQTNAMEVGRFAGDGTFYVGATTLNVNSSTDTGAFLAQAGRVTAVYDGAAAALIGRQTSDGNLVQFYQAGVNEGAISVSGTTITYGSFSGSHWSQLSDGSKPDILVGTVVETINEKCVWPGAENDQLAKFKISDTPASKCVYGVFMAWDNDDDETNDAFITSLGAYLVRIAAGVTVQNGDLLESNGDGCARVQSDDIIRSSTIGKVTCTIPTATYPDGSYTVPCVLYCG